MHEEDGVAVGAVGSELFGQQGNGGEALMRLAGRHVEDGGPTPEAGEERSGPKGFDLGGGEKESLRCTGVQTAVELAIEVVGDLRQEPGAELDLVGSRRRVDGDRSAAGGRGADHVFRVPRGRSLRVSVGRGFSREMATVRPSRPRMTAREVSGPTSR